MTEATASEAADLQEDAELPAAATSGSADGPAPTPRRAFDLSGRAFDWSRHATTAGAALAAWLFAAVVLHSGAPVAASAAGWLGPIADPTAEAAPLAWLLARAAAKLPAQVRAEVSWALQWLQIAIAGLGFFGVFSLARAAAGLSAGCAAVVVALAWPDAREGLTTVSAEAVVAVAGVWAAWGALHVPDQPLRGGIVLAVCAALMAVATPAGLVLAPLCLLAALCLPTATAPDSLEHETGRPDLPAGNRWLAWSGAVALAMGLVLVALHGQSLKTWGAHQLTALRAPTDASVFGLCSKLPVGGTVLALLLQLPIVAAILGLHSLKRALTYELTTALAAPMGILLALTTGLAVIGVPAVGLIDPLRTLAPLFCVLIGTALARRLLALFSERRWLAMALWSVAVAAAFAAEVRMLQTDRRNLIGRVPGLFTQAEPFQPAVLRPADIALLAHFDQPTAVLPARAGGASLATALKAALPAVKVPGFFAAHRAALVVLPEPPRHLIDRALGDHGTKLACTADLRLCIHRIAGRSPAK